MCSFVTTTCGSKYPHYFAIFMAAYHQNKFLFCQYFWIIFQREYSRRNGGGQSNKNQLQYLLSNYKEDAILFERAAENPIKFLAQFKYRIAAK